MMNYEKFKAEIQEEFHGEWQFSDESTRPGRVEFNGIEWGQIKRFSARRGTLSICWKFVPGTDFPATMRFSLARPVEDVLVMENRFRSIADVKSFLLSVESGIGMFVRNPEDNK